MATSTAASQTPTSVNTGSIQITTIDLELKSRQKSGEYSIEVFADSTNIARAQFQPGGRVATCAFNPPYSLRAGVTLVVKVFRRRKRRLGRPELMCEDKLRTAEVVGILSVLAGQNLPDYVLRDDTNTKISANLSMVGLPALLEAGVDVTRELPNYIDKLGKCGPIIGALMSFGVAVSELNPRAKAALTSVSAFYERLKAQQAFDDDLRAIVTEMADSIHCFVDIGQFASLAQLKLALEKVTPLVEETVNFVQIYSRRSTLSRFFVLTLDTFTRNTLEGLVRRFQHFKHQFDRGLAVQSGIAVQEIRAQLDGLVSRTEQSVQLAMLRPSLSSREPERCMAGTREDVLAEIREWANDLDSENVFWLRGHPGVGKSAIAYSVAAALHKEERLGSSYFFRRENAKDQRPSAVWRSVAWDLAERYPRVREAAVNGLKSKEIDLTVMTANELFEKLIRGPLNKCEDSEIPSGRLPVIVIDALDECGGFDGEEHQRSILKAITAWRTSLSPRFKMVVTSRDQGEIGLTLRVSGRCRILEVGNKATPQSSRDIKAYLCSELGEIRARYEWLPSHWPDETVIELLTSAASGLFIWATTVIRILNTGEPGERLENISVLTANFHHPFDIKSFVALSGAIIAARRPLHLSDVVRLQQVGEGKVRWVCNQLRPVLASTDTMHFYHQSFVDYLSNENSGCPEEFRFQRSMAEETMASACFNLMERDLHFNMASLESSFTLNDELVGLTARIPDVVQYCCAFWASHLENLPCDDKLHELVLSFMHQRLLFWLEVASIIEGGLRTAIHSLSSLQSRCNATACEEIRMFSRDALSFIRVFAHIISRSTPHLYLSALHIAPVSSYMRRHYAQKVAHVLHAPNGVYDHWPVHRGVMRANGQVKSVVFSSDGQRIASGSSECAVRLWDADTLLPVGDALYGHEAWVNAVAFSPDGRRIASGSDDCTIRLWDAETLQPVGEALHHDGKVKAVAFTPDGRQIASGSDDCTVRLWDAETLHPIGEALHGHDGNVNAVAFSPDGRRIVSSSSDCTVRLWDTDMLQPIGDALRGHEDYVHSVAFSPDGSRIASGSDDCTVRLWDVDTLRPIGNALHGHERGVNSVAFSPDGQRIVSGSDDRVVRLWDANTLPPVGNALPAHEGGVNSVVFSPDGRRIASGSNDSTIRLWDADTLQPVGDALRGHKDSVLSVSFSPDGRWIASGSCDSTIGLWDANMLQPVGDALRGHEHRIWSVAFSPDGRRIVSGSDDHTVRLWDADALQPIGDALRGHERGVNSVAYSPGGRRIVSGSDDCTVRLWDADMLQPIGDALHGHEDNVWLVTLSPDGRRIASGSGDSTIRLWGTDTLQPVGDALRGHRDAVWSVAFSPDGRRIVSGSDDHTIRLWDADTLQLIGDALHGHEGGVNSVAFSPDSRRIASGSSDHTVRLWNASGVQSTKESLPTPTTDSLLKDKTPSSMPHIATPSERFQENAFSSNGQNLSEEVIIDVDGRILGPNSELLLWVPEDLVRYLPRHRLLGIIGGARPMVEFDASDFRFGTRWTECACEEWQEGMRRAQARG